MASFSSPVSLFQSESSDFSASSGMSDGSCSVNSGDTGHSSPSFIRTTGASGPLPGGATLLPGFATRHQYPGLVKPCSSVDRDYFSTGAKGAPTLTSIVNSFPTMLSTTVRVIAEPVKEVSIYAALVPDVKFDCYYSIKPWVSMASARAWEEIDAFLPTSGPVVALDLGLLLAYVTFAFDLKTMKLPHLTSSVIAGYKFLHFCTSKIVPVASVIAALVNYDGFVGGSIGGVDPMNMINVAASVGATTIAAADASDAYKKTLHNLTTVTTMMTERQVGIIRKERPAVKFVNSDSHTGDHALMAAYREIIRADMRRYVNPDADKERTLVLGATEREIRAYNHNAYFHFQLANKEAKDTVRLVSDVIKDVRARQNKKLSRTKDGVAHDRTSRYVKQLTTVLEDWVLDRKIPERFILWEESQALFEHGVLFDADELDRRQEIAMFSTFKRPVNLVCTAVVDAWRNNVINYVPFAEANYGTDNYSKCCFDRIIFEDVGYNFSQYDWYKIFRSTNAIHAIGYMCLPWELAFPEIIPQEAYKYKVDGEYSCLAYPGHANGYKHKTSKWATFMKQTVIDIKDLTIGIEIISRAGPMALVRLFRSQGNDNFLSCRVLPKDLATVKLLDIRRSTDQDGKLMLDKLTYFRVRREEFEDALNYALDISKESLSHRNVCVYVRRKTMGMSLVTKEMSRVWLINPGLVGDFSQVVYLCALYRLAHYDRFEKEIKKVGFNPFLMLIERTINRITSPIRSVLKLFMTDHDYQKLLVVDLPDEFWIDVDSKCATKRKELTDVVFAGPDPEGLYPDGYDFREYDDKDPPKSCTYCMELMGCLGSQIIRCRTEAEEDYFHEFKLSDAELKTFRTNLADTAHDPPGIKAIKEKALSFVPSAAPTIECRVRYICGPPGTGKSYAIRGMARHDDLIVGPFSRLKEDYTNFVHPVDGRRSSLLFLTQHAAMEAQNHTTVYVDEYTAFPYECLVIIALRCNASEVVLVGDHRQTGLINGVEGISIGSKIDVHSLRSHELVKNYRNPSDAVALLNTKYHYRMMTTNTRVGYVYDNDLTHYADYPAHYPLFFKYASAERFGVSGATSDKITVRANQGATYDDVKLVVLNSDHELFTNPSMAIVALSRHRKQCVILYEPGGLAEIFVEDIKSCIANPTLDNDSESDDDDNNDDRGGNDNDDDTGSKPRNINSMRFGRGEIAQPEPTPEPDNELGFIVENADFLTRQLVTFWRSLDPTSVWSRMIRSVLLRRPIVLRCVRVMRYVFYVHMVVIVLSRVSFSVGIVDVDVVLLVRGLFRYLMPRFLYSLIIMFITFVNRLMFMLNAYFMLSCRPIRVIRRDRRDDDDDGHDWLTRYISNNFIHRQPRITRDVNNRDVKIRYTRVSREGGRGRSHSHFTYRTNDPEQAAVLKESFPDVEIFDLVERPVEFIPETIVEGGSKGKEVVEPYPLCDDKYLLPRKNICLLETIRSYTSESLVQIWRDFVDCCDESFRERVIAAGISLYDFDRYCIYKNCRYKVIGLDGIPAVCGNEGDMMGAIVFSGPIDAGHFQPGKVAEVVAVAPASDTPKATVDILSNIDNKRFESSVDNSSLGLVDNADSTKKFTLNTLMPQEKPIIIPALVGDHKLVVDDNRSTSKSDKANGGSTTQYLEGKSVPKSKKGKKPTKYNNSWCAELGRNKIISDLKDLELASSGMDWEFKQSVNRTLDHLVKKFRARSEIDSNPKYVRGVNAPLLGDSPPIMKSYISKDVATKDMKTLFDDFDPAGVGLFLPAMGLLLNPTTVGGKTLLHHDEIKFRCRYTWYRWFVRNFSVVSMGSMAYDAEPDISVQVKTIENTNIGSVRNLNDDPMMSISATMRNDLQRTVMYAKHIPLAVGGAETEVRPVSCLGPVECREIIVEPLATADPDFLNVARFFLNPVAVTHYLAAINELPSEPLVSLEQSSYDCFKMLVEEFTTVHEKDLILTNQESLNYLETKFGTGLFDVTRLDNLNQRGHPKKNRQEAWSLLAVAPGVTYFKNSLMQSLACLQTRYLTKSMAVMFTYESQKFAYDIADLFFFEHMVDNFDIFNEQDIWMTVMESEHSMKIKNYESQVNYAMGGDTDVRFNMKDIFKPFKTKIDLFKAGQGISAWSKDTQTLFQSAFRVINKHFINSLLPHVVYDNGIDEVTMMNRVNALFSCLPSVCVNGVIDATACDSGQNRFTQRIERRVLERLGLREEFLDLYYSYREEYILKGYGVTARITDIKTSGEPATLLNNTILMAALMNYLVRGQGPCVLVIKGDDGLKRQANIVYDERLKSTMKKYLKMDFKVDIDVPITFCGYFLYERYLVPDLVRKVFKVLGHKFADFDHFQEYQESLRDWILNANKLGVSDICFIAANSYNLTPEYCYQLFHAIVSLSHINEEQFKSVFVRRCFDWDQPYPVSEKWSEKAEWYSGPN